MTATPNRQLVICKDAATLAETAARRFSQLARDTVAEKGKFSVALSGGSTPKAMFSLLAAAPLNAEVPWASTFVFWSDERTVPPDHPDSNYRMAYESLISKVPLPESNVFRMRGEDDPAKAAEEYQREFTGFFGPGSPRFDLILLGMGDDGHTASLFPGTEALNIKDRQVVSNYVKKLNTYRLTMTRPAINAAAAVSFLVSGAGKAPTLKRVLQGELDPNQLPSQSIRPVNGTLTWIADREAVADLSLPEGTLNGGSDVIEISI